MNHSRERNTLRKSMMDRLGVVCTATDKPMSELMHSEWSPEFERLMRNRLIMGAMRYGHFGSQGKGLYDCIAEIIRRAKLYDATGNDELLVDIANLAMVEYVEGCHPLKHFAAQDDAQHTPKIAEGD